MAPERKHDVVVVGGGAAGLYSALTAADGGSRVAMVSRKPLPESSSFWAQGGLAAAIGPDDSPPGAQKLELRAGWRRRSGPTTRLRSTSRTRWPPAGTRAGARRPSCWRARP